MKRASAAIKGAKEVGFAVVAMTLTLAAVYAPVAFTTGRIGRLFVEFALTLAGAVIVSGFVALTLSPMMSAYLLPDAAHEDQRLVRRRRVVPELTTQSIDGPVRQVERDDPSHHKRPE